MGGLALLALIGFFMLCWLDGSLGLFLLQCIAALVVYFAVASLGTGRRAKVSNTAKAKLRRDIRRLQACKKADLDAGVCLEVGPCADAIRYELDRARAAVAILGKRRNAEPQAIRDLFGGVEPSAHEVELALQRLRGRISTLEAWLSDWALREILRTTGKLLTPAGVAEELEARLSRVETLTSDVSKRGQFDITAATILAVLTVLFPVLGIAGAVAYVIIQKTR